MMIVADIVVFDLEGPEFLLLFGIAFVGALFWSLSRRSGANRRFELPGADETVLTDPYEIAYLAGGAPRCSQVVLVRLIKSGAIKWKRPKVFRESKVIAVGTAESDFNGIEQAVFSSILSYGKKGMPLSEIPPLVATRLSGIESKLAKLGLRPTTSEKSGRGFWISLPLLLLFLIGLIKLVVGLSRDKPVGFLVVGLFFTVFAAVVVAINAKKLTSAGERLLEKMRNDGRSSPHPNGDPDFSVLCGVALLGIGGVSYDEAITGLDAELKKQISQIGNASSSSGCGSGCSSGCSSGCGGGCGGCGGD